MCLEGLVHLDDEGRLDLGEDLLLIHDVLHLALVANFGLRHDLESVLLRRGFFRG